MFEATGGVLNTYRMLLGDKVINTMIKALGRDASQKFLKLHAKYDYFVKKSPKADPMQAMRAQDIPVFKDFDSYLSFLKKLENQLKIMREPISKAMYEVIVEMLKVVDQAAKTEKSEPENAEATASEDGYNVRYGKTIFRSHNLPGIPLQMRDTKNLPYSYPSWEATLEIVKKIADEKNFKQRIEAELTESIKLGLVKVLAELPKDEHKTIPQLVAEAQEYLMDHNWIQYGLENVAKASHNIATAGIKHRISTNGVIKHIANTRTLAYAFLGANAEMILRKGCYAILKDISENMIFAGKSASFDVLSAASSFYVQDLGRNWLDNLQSKLK